MTSSDANPAQGGFGNPWTLTVDGRALDHRLSGVSEARVHDVLAAVATDVEAWVGARMLVETVERMRGRSPVYRVVLAGGHVVVVKGSSPNEARALARLREVGTVARGVQQLVACVEDGDQAWVVLAHVDGANAPPGRVPLDVFQTLAEVHAHYRSTPLPELRQRDSAYWRLQTNWTVELFAQRADDDEGVARAHEQVCAWVDDPAVHQALSVLPRTLVHGDMHNGNVLVGGDGRSVIVDWGEAGSGPPIADLENLVCLNWTGRSALLDLDEVRSLPPVRRYLDASDPIDPEEFAIGWYHAVAQVRSHYGAVGIAYGNNMQGSVRMIAEGSEAIARLRSIFGYA